MTDLSKACDCIPHDLLIAKTEPYVLAERALSYIYSYLTNRNQCVRINDKKSNFQKINSGVPQGSVTGPVLFNISLFQVHQCTASLMINLCLPLQRINDTLIYTCYSKNFEKVTLRSPSI